MSLISPLPSNQRAVLLVASAGCAITVLDTNVVGIVLPEISRDLVASFAQAEWIISSYVLCFAALLLPAGSIADRYGRKRILLLGIGLFSAASLACGVSPSAASLVIARACQGIGAAFLLAPALAIIGHAFHEEQERTRAWAIWGGIMGLTMVASPLIGGAISNLLGWRWAFHINLPVCALLAFAVLRQIEESREPTPRRLDIPGIALFALAMLGVTSALILGPGHGWSSKPVLLSIGCGSVLFAAFIWTERHRNQPMLDLDLFSSLPFLGATLAMFAYAASAQVMASLLPQFLQNGLGYHASAAGIGMLPFALAMLVFPQVGRRLSPHFKSGGILVLGLCVVAVGNLVMMIAARGGGGTLLVLGMSVLGAGGGLLNGETQKAIMGTVTKDRAGMASGISTTSRFTGILIGFSGLGAVLAGGTRRALEEDMAMRMLPVKPGFFDAIVAGDHVRALEGYPATTAESMASFARDAYSIGFSQAFLAAALFASLTAVLVHYFIRRLHTTG